VSIVSAFLLGFLSVFFQDDFNDGNADGWYTVGPSDFAVEDGRYHFSGGGAVNDATSYRGDLGEIMSTADYSMTADVEIDVGTFGGMMVRYREEGAYNLLLVLSLPGQSLNLYRWYFSSIELVDSYPMTVSADTPLRVRFQCLGNEFAGRAWVPGETEPEEWFVSTADTISQPGSAALFSAGVFKGGSRVYMSCYFDNTVVQTPEPWSLRPNTWGILKTMFP
jgi:hypothetical protein